MLGPSYSLLMPHIGEKTMPHASPNASRFTLPQHMHIHDVLEGWAVRTPDAPALVASGRIPLTYGRLYRHIDEMVQRLRALGVGVRTGWR